jgi:hypothetical protein
MPDRCGDDWTVADSALCWALGALIAVFVVGNIGVFLAPESKQSAQRCDLPTPQASARSQSGRPDQNACSSR